MKPSVGAAAAGLLLLVAALVAAVVTPWDSVVATVLATAALVALGAAAILERRLLGAVLRGRQVRMGSLSAVATASVLVGLAALAFLAERHSVVVDLTREHRHSLGAEARHLVDSLPAAGGPIELFGLMPPSGAPPSQASADLQRLLPVFRMASHRLTVREVEWQKDPALVRALGAVSAPSVAVRWTAPGEKEPRIRRTESITEESIARALQDCVSGKLPVVYLTNGHGELDAADATPAGALAWAEDLKAANHDVRPLALGAARVPDDASLVVMAGPSTDLLPAEVQSLGDYESKGGRLLVLLGPPPPRDPAPAGAAPPPADRPNLVKWLSDDWGVDAPERLLADLDSIAAAGDPTVLVVTPSTEASHPIVARFHLQLLAPVSRDCGCRPLFPVGVGCTNLLSTGPQSWAETDLTRSPSFDAADVKGPRPLGAAATRKPYPQEKEARLVVLGCPFMAANGQYGKAGNRSFLRNCVDWASGREADLAAHADETRDGTVVVAATQGRVIMLTTFALPAVLLLAGLATWWRRRQL